MKTFLLTAQVLFSFFCNAQFILGEKIGYYGGGMPDESYDDLMYNAGARAASITLSFQQYLQFGGLADFEARFQYPYVTKGMRGNVFNLTATQGPTYAGQTDSSWLPNGFQLPAFNADGSINVNNLWAKYCYDVVQSVGPYFQYYEVWNEPDLAGNNVNPSTDWVTTEPKSSQLPNLKGTVEDYVQLCKVANQVIKKFQPTAKICTGGLGYPQFYSWFLKRGGGQWIDDNSIHFYPYWHWTSNTGAQRNSSYAAKLNDSIVVEFRNVDLGTKPMIMTENNLPRWRYEDGTFPNNKRWGSDICQLDYTLKLISHMANAGLSLMTLYQTGETADSGTNDGTAGSEIDAMGVYKKLVGVTTEAAAVMTHSGQAMRAYTGLLGNYKIDTSQKPASPTVEFSFWDSLGKKAYIISAVTTKDTNETASAVYEFPDKGEYDVYDCFGKFNRICVDTIHLTGTSNFCLTHQTALALVPPPRLPDSSFYANQISIFPNPANNYFDIRIGSPLMGGILITAYDASGHLQEINNSHFVTGLKSMFDYDVRIPVSLPAGIYFIKIQINADAEVIKKIIIIR